MKKNTEDKHASQEARDNPTVEEENEQPPSPSAVDALIRLTSDMQLFHDQHKEAYVFHEGQCIKLKSREVNKRLSYQMYLNTGRTPNGETLNSAITTLEGIATFERDMVELENRVAKHHGDFLYDLGNHQSVCTTASGWSIINAPPKFYRHKHQSIQVSPLAGDIFDIFNYINVSEENRLLVIVTLVSYFIPEIPHPIFHPWGAQGSGKTSLFKVFKRLVDPSIAETLMCSNDRSKVIHALVKHYLPLFDNLSGINGEISDLLCQACTGGGIEQRKLYTDDESIIFQILRCVGINGINLSVIKPDLLDRTILLHLTRIDSNLRRSEAELWEGFKKARPHILGGIFDLLSKAIAIYPQVKLTSLPRLADFGLWGYAIAEAIEKGQGKQFINDYKMNIDRQVEESVQSSTLALAVLNYMESTDKFETTIAAAFVDFRRLIEPDSFDKSFPRAPRDLRRYLERIKATLEAKNVIFTIGNRTAHGIPIIFEKTENFASSASSASSIFPFENEGNEANVPVQYHCGTDQSEFYPDDVPFVI